MDTGIRPVLLIHGMNGTPAHWHQSGYYRLLLERGYRAGQIGVLEWGRNRFSYNNTGDLSIVAQRIPTAIDDLIRTSGMQEVDIISYSAGGLVARAYLAEMERNNRPHRVRKLVMIGTPNLGSFWMMPDHRWVLIDRVRFALEQGNTRTLLSPLYEMLARGIALVLENWIKVTLRPIIGSGLGCLVGWPLAEAQMNTIAAKQMQPDSQFLRVVNATIPSDVTYCAIFGDIRLLIRGLGLGDLVLPPIQIELGDMLVDVPSATGIGLFDAQTVGFQTILGDDTPDPHAPVAEIEDAVALVANLIRRVAPPHNHGLLFVERPAQQAALDFLLSGRMERVHGTDRTLSRQPAGPGNG